MSLYGKSTVLHIHRTSTSRVREGFERQSKRASEGCQFPRVTQRTAILEYRKANSPRRFHPPRSSVQKKGLCAQEATSVLPAEGQRERSRVFARIILLPTGERPRRTPLAFWWLSFRSAYRGNRIGLREMLRASSVRGLLRPVPCQSFRPYDFEGILVLALFRLKEIILGFTDPLFCWIWRILI